MISNKNLLFIIRRIFYRTFIFIIIIISTLLISYFNFNVSTLLFFN